MPIINRIAEFHPEMTAWRRDLHQHPEIGFQEVRTARIVAEKLGVIVLTNNSAPARLQLFEPEITRPAFSRMVRRVAWPPAP